MNKLITIDGKTHKVWMLENSIDKQNKCRISVRALNDSGVGLEIGWKNILSNWNYYSRKYSNLRVLENDDRESEPVNDETIWKYGIERGYWDSEEVELCKFSNKVEKKISRLDDRTILNFICRELDERTIREYEDIGSLYDYLNMVYGENKIKKIKAKIISERSG